MHFQSLTGRKMSRSVIEAINCDRGNFRHYISQNAQRPFEVRREADWGQDQFKKMTRG
jgi:hypothetical protein